VSEHPIFARFYDRMTAGMEKATMREARAELLRNASGRTLELGAGTGHNLEHYTEAVTELILAEPDPHMAARLREKLDKEGTRARNPQVVEVPAEDLPFDDESCDTVIATLVLCTVTDPLRAISEARRVLVEGGSLLYIEHVRSSSTRLAHWQDRLERPWGWMAGGCHPNRATDQLIEGAGFWVDQMDRTTLRGTLPLIRPLITGVARRPAGVASAEE
jgi:ubiquinone/menaquinone biosynthesis C-methylase UbiE